MGTSISSILQVTTSSVGVPPGLATGLTLTNVTTSGATLSWTIPSIGSPPLSYMPQYKISGAATWTNAISQAQTGTSIAISGLHPGTAYNFQVVTSSPYPPSSNSTTASVSTLSIVPGAPVLSNSVSVTGTTATVSWSVPSGTLPLTYAVGYRLSGAGSFTILSPTSATSQDVSGLTAGTAYDFEVAASNAAGAGPESNIVTTTTSSGVSVPSAPQNLTVTGTTSNSATVSWSAPSSGSPTSYDVLYFITASTSSTATITGITGTTETILNLQPNTAYTVQVYGVNSAGTGSGSAVVQATTAGSTVRSPYLQPGGNVGVSPWNTPIGSGAVFSKSTDAATISLTSKSNTVNAASFGQTVVVGTASDPLVKFTSSGGSGSQRDPNLTVTIRCPTNTQPSPPYPGGDNQITVFDTTLSPAKVYCFQNCTFVNGTDVTGGVSGSYGEQDLICGSMADALTGNYGYDSGVGVIRAWELDSTKNPSGRLRHVLRFACDPTQLLPPTDWATPINPTTGAVQIYWPQTHVDYNGPTAYTGSMPGGALVAIPSNTLVPSGLSTGGVMLFDCLKNYGAMWRDTASGGVTFYTEPQLENNTIIGDMRGDMAKIIPLLRIVTNVGPTAIGGGGTAIDSNPAPSVDPGICGATTVPGAPTSLTTIGQATTTIGLSWVTGSGTLPQTFTVQVSPTGTGTWSTAASGLTSNTYTATALVASTGYDFRVSATNSAGTGVYSSVLSNVKTTAASGTTLNPTTSLMTLSNSNMSASSTGAGFETAASTTFITSTSGMRQFEFYANAWTGDLAVGIINQYYLFNQTAGLGGEGNGVGFYGTLNSDTYCGSGTPLLPTGTLNSATGEVITVVFDPSVPQIWFSTQTMRTAGFTYNNSTTANPANSTGGYNLSGLLITGNYYIAVNDDQSGGVATLNTGALAFTLAMPTGVIAWDTASGGGGGVAASQVTGLVVGSPKASSLSVSWNASTGSPTISYIVQRAPTSTGAWTTVATTTSTSYIDGSLTALTTYFYQVQASNSYGTASYSAAVSGTTTTTGSTSGLLSSGSLSTSGNQIIDSLGNNQRIAAADWGYGYDRPPTLFGLNTATYQQNLDSMKAEGFNCVRLHTCDAGVIAGDQLATTSFSATLNPGFVGKTLLECYQLIMTYGATIGMRFIVDSHSNEGNLANQGNGLWYDVGGASNGTDASGNTGTVTDADFVSAWQTRATAFNGYTALLGYDIRNEPQSYTGQCTWGGMAGATAGSNTDIRYMYERVGNAIHAIDTSYPLIICEGPQNYTGSFIGTTGVICPEGDLTGVSSYPVTLTQTGKVVYSVHCYPASVSGMAAGTDTGTIAITRWMDNWGDVFQNKLGPIWVGECGDTLVSTADQNWATTFTSFMNGTAQGGITMSGTEQGPGFGWWVWCTQSDANAGNGSLFAITTAYDGGAIQSGQAKYIESMEFGSTTSAGNAPPISPPLSGATAGTWTLKQSGGMYYWELLPYGYSTSYTYPLMLCLHQLDQANPFYQNGNDPTQDLVKPQWDPWVNNTTFRNDHPCIIILPLLDQTTDINGTTINFGGVNSGDTTAETTCISIVNHYISNYSVNANKVYVTGNSMGGIGSWDMIIKWNTKNPLETKIFAAALILAGADYAFNYPNPTATMISNMKSVPIWSIHGANDTQVPLAWDQNMYAVIGINNTTSGGLTAAGLVSYLHTIAGTSVISGQFIERGGDPTLGYAAIQTIQTNTGYWLGLIGGDYYYSGSTGPADLTVNQYATTYWNNGGLFILNPAMPNPTTGGYSGDVSALNTTDLLVSGTATNTNLLSTFDQIAAGLQDLQNSGVVVMIRPLLEMNGNWNWWGTSFLTDAQFISLWQYMHNYFTNTKGLTNLVWVWAANAGFNYFPQTTSRYPGDAYVDMVGFDLYTDSPLDTADYDALMSMAPTKLVCMAEFGPGGPSAGDPSFNENTLISALASMPNIVLWQQWWDGNSGGAGWGMAETSSWADVKTALSNSRVINRGGMGAYFNGGTTTSSTGGNMHYTQDASLGHDVWDTYYVEPTSETYWSWLFSQNF